MSLTREYTEIDARRWNEPWPYVEPNSSDRVLGEDVLKRTHLTVRDEWTRRVENQIEDNAHAHTRALAKVAAETVAAEFESRVRDLLDKGYSSYSSTDLLALLRPRA